MPTIDTKLMTMQASLEHQLGEARAGAAEARAELAICDGPGDTPADGRSTTAAT